MLYLIYYPLNFLAFVLGWILIIVTTLKVLYGPNWLQERRSKYFARMWILNGEDIYKKATRKTKDDLFSSMKDLESADPELRNKKALNILEVGVGCGSNFPHYPAGSKLTCIEPNRAFESHFQSQCAAKATHLHPDIRFVAERGEDMFSVAGGSVDAVVVTLVMCSIQEVAMFLREVRRVLVPGGRLYYLEHSATTPGTWRRRVQDALSNSGLWGFVHDGCMLNFDPRKALVDAGFSKLDNHVVCFSLDGTTTPYTGGQTVGILNPFQYGVATK